MDPKKISKAGNCSIGNDGNFGMAILQNVPCTDILTITLSIFLKNGVMPVVALWSKSLPQA